MAEINGIFRGQRVSSSGLRASRQWMNLISNNIANANTVDSGKRAKDGNYVPYARQVPVFAKVLSENFRENKVNSDVINGVKVEDVVHVKDNVKKIYDPNHPAARRPGTQDAGYVYFPAISNGQEMADMKMASSSYEANVTALSVSTKMLQQALSLGRR